MHELTHFLLPNEDEEDEHAENDVGDVRHDPVPVGTTNGEANQLHCPVDAHHHEQFQVKAVSKTAVQMFT